MVVGDTGQQLQEIHECRRCCLVLSYKLGAMPQLQQLGLSGQLQPFQYFVLPLDYGLLQRQKRLLDGFGHASFPVHESHVCLQRGFAVVADSVLAQFGQRQVRLPEYVEYSITDRGSLDLTDQQFRKVSSQLAA